MKENRKLLKEVLRDIQKDMTDEEVLALLADSRVSVNPAEEKAKYTLGQRAADAIAKFAGSWAFIFSFTGGLVLWMVINTVLATRAFDPYPFILLNLVAVLHRGYSGAADHDEPESTGGKGSPPRRERLQGQPENRDHDRGSLRQGQRYTGQAVGAGKAFELSK